MLDQFHQNIQDNMDDLQEQNLFMTRRRLIIILSGAAFALLSFLFIIGMFRKNESSTLAYEEAYANKPQELVHIENRLSDIMVRLEKVEEQVREKTLASVLEAPPVAMTDKAIKQFLAMQDTPVQEDPISSIVGITTQENAEEQMPFQPQTQPKPISSSKSESPAKNTQATPSARIHVVQKGETLSQISVRYFGTPNRWKAIYEANKDRISNINQLKVGTQLVIP